MSSLKSSVKTKIISVQFKKTLIMKVKEHPSVWKNSETLDSHQRRKAWKSIEREMGFFCSLKEIQATWASLSESYFRIIFLKTIERNFEAPVWQFFHEMIFLYDHVKETIQNMLGGISPPLFKPRPNSKESQESNCPCCAHEGPDGNPELDISLVELEFKKEDEAENITSAIKEASLENNENSTGSVNSIKVHTIYSLDNNNIAVSPRRDLMKDNTVEVIQLINYTEPISESPSPQFLPANFENMTEQHSSESIIFPLQETSFENSENSIGCAEKVPAIISLDGLNSKNQTKFCTYSTKLQQNLTDNSLAKLLSKDSQKDKPIKIIEFMDDSEKISNSTSSHIQPPNLQNLTSNHFAKQIICLPLPEVPFGNISNSITSEKPYTKCSLDAHISENQSKMYINSQKLHLNDIHNTLAKAKSKNLMKDSTVEIIELMDGDGTSSVSTTSQFPQASLVSVTENHSSKDTIRPLQEKSLENIENSNHNIEKRSEFLTNSRNIEQNETDNSLTKSLSKDFMKAEPDEVIELIDDNETSSQSTISQLQPESHENVTYSHSSKDIICRQLQENHSIGPNSSVGLIKLKSSLSINDYLEDDCSIDTEPESHSIEQTQSSGLSRKDSKGVLILRDKSNGKAITRLVETVNKLRAIKRSEIIEAIKANPATYLYNGIKKKKLFQEAWNKVAEDLGNIPLEALKNRWKLIKTRYLKELVFERYGNQKSSWECFDQLEFLRPYMQKDIEKITFTGVQIKSTVEKGPEDGLNSAKSTPASIEPLHENKKISNISNIKEIVNNHNQLNIRPINVSDYVKRNQNIRIASVESLCKLSPTDTYCKRSKTKQEKPVVLDANTLPILLNRPVKVTAVKVVPSSNENAVVQPPAKKLRITSVSDKNGTNVLATKTHTKLTSLSDFSSTFNKGSEGPIATDNLMCLQQYKLQKVPLTPTLEKDLPVSISTSKLRKISTSISKRLSEDEECVYTCKYPVKVTAVKVVPSLNLTNKDNNKEKSNDSAVAQPPAKIVRIASGSDKNGTNVLATVTQTKSASLPDSNSALNKASEVPITTANPICLQQHKLQTVFPPLDLTLDEDLPLTVSPSPLRKISTSKSKRLSEDDECVYTCKVFPTLDLTGDEDNDDDKNASKTEKQIATTSMDENKKDEVNVICLDDDDSEGFYSEVFNYLSEDKH